MGARESSVEPGCGRCDRRPVQPGVAVGLRLPGDQRAHGVQLEPRGIDLGDAVAPQDGGGVGVDGDPRLQVVEVDRAAGCQVIERGGSQLLMGASVAAKQRASWRNASVSRARASCTSRSLATGHGRAHSLASAAEAFAPPSLARTASALGPIVSGGIELQSVRGRRRFGTWAGSANGGAAPRITSACAAATCVRWTMPRGGFAIEAASRASCHRDRVAMAAHSLRTPALWWQTKRPSHP